MAQQIINIGASANDGQGNPIRTAFAKTNDNFSELYSRAQVTPPPTLVGSLGDSAGMYAYDSTYFYYCFADYDGSSTIWAQVTQVGNISVTQINNGTSDVVVDLNGNIRMTVANVANTVQFTTVGQELIGELNATGNVTGNYIIGDGSLLTNLPIPGIYGNTQVAQFLPTYTGNLVSLAGPVVTTGNVTGNYIIGDGSLLTNVNAANVSTSKISNGFSQINIPVSNDSILVDVGIISNLAVFNTTGISVVGTVSATNLSATGNIAATGTVTTAAVSAGSLTGTLTTASQTNITSIGTLLSLSVAGNVVANNLSTTDFVSATGNITGSYIYGNGAFLTGVTGSGGNGTAIVNGLSKVDIPVSAGNVAVTVGFNSNVAVFTNNGLEINGNLSANNILSSLVISATGNLMGGNITTAGLITATGNITGAYIIGDGSLLTNIATGTSYGNANVAAYLPTYSGNLSAGNLSISGQANVTGNINVQNSARVNGTVQGQLYGLTNGVNTIYGTWDFGFVTANTYDNPIQWIFAQTSAGNVDMGNITAPTSLSIDIGTIF
jgi:cytoskeletal protein CcmA (bactofilin family)